MLKGWRRKGYYAKNGGERDLPDERQMFIHHVGPFNRTDSFRRELHPPPNDIHNILYARDSTS